MLMVPPAVNTPQPIALALGEEVEVVTNWKCSVVLFVLALAAVMLLPATTAAKASVPTAAPKALRMMPLVSSAVDPRGNLARLILVGIQFSHLVVSLIRPWHEGYFS
jgi:hypothetical protein